MNTILFVGTHNVFRSKYAEAYFNYIAGKVKIKTGGTLGDRITAVSRGTYIKQGRFPRFTPLWDSSNITAYYPTASKLRYFDIINATAIFGMYEPEQRPQLGKYKTPAVQNVVRGDWSPEDVVNVEYWRIPNLIGSGNCTDGSELDDPREIIGLIEYNVELLIDNIDIYL
jgi:protein-tyrosine-phosphatase